VAAFFELQGGIFDKYVPKLVLDSPKDFTFRGGAVVTQPLPTPLVFTTGHSAKEPPKGMHGRVVPVMSDAFIAALRGAGVSNLQCFPAELRSTKDNSVWKNYQAVNIVGLIACADLEASEYKQVAERPEEDASPLLAFDELKVDSARAGDALLFRLGESPGIILIADRVVEFLLSQASEDEWGITLEEK
jgi:hypothetical protein